MSAVRQGKQFALCAGLGLILFACGSSAPDDTATAGNGAPLVDNFPSGNAGQGSGTGFKGWQKDAAGSGGAAGQAVVAAGSGGAAGSAGAAAGSSGAAGSAGVAAAAGKGGTGGSAGSSEPSEPDPFDLLGLGAAGATGGDPIGELFGEAGAPAPAAANSCTDVVCIDHADCQAPERASCRFTRCENFVCM